MALGPGLPTRAALRYDGRNRTYVGLGGYFRYGNSAQFFDKISLHAVNRLSIFVANCISVTGGSGGGSLPATPRTAWG